MPFYPPPASVSEEAQQLATTQNQFGLTLLQKLCRENKEENLFFSPFSIAAALTVLLDGLTGTAYEDLARLLGVVDWEQESRSNALAEQLDFLSRDANGNAVLRTAIGLWTNKPLAVGYEYETRI